MSGADAQRRSAARGPRDWRGQMRERVSALDALRSVWPAFTPTAAMRCAAERFPVLVTPYYASLVAAPSADDPVFRMCVPDGGELQTHAYLSDDPFAEACHTPVPGLVHRYANRALILAAGSCAVHCRYCMRRRPERRAAPPLGGDALARVADYIAAHPAIDDVLLSGGDPLTLPTDALERILRAIRSVPTVRIIRIGTRIPAVLPMRVTRELTAMLRRYHPLYLCTHFNHPVELTAEARTACGRLADAGIVLANQSVLLRGVNDTLEILAALCRGLLDTRVRPYYLFQTDLVSGTEHFRTPLGKGLALMEGLRATLSGLAVPVFAVDAPDGGGKIPLFPESIVQRNPDCTVLRAPSGKRFVYPEPIGPDNGLTGNSTWKTV
jgi:lysine 2,3-aminomutase